MAAVQLWRGEERLGRLPAVCMRCGEPAEVYRWKTFSWYPGWVNVIILAGLLPWLVVALVLRKSMSVEAPLCGRHVNHWRGRDLFVWLGLAAWVGLAVAVGVISSRELLDRDAMPVLFGVLVLGGLGWLITALVLATGAIRPAEITDRGMRLSKVSPVFRDALNAAREEAMPVANPVAPPPAGWAPRPPAGR